MKHRLILLGLATVLGLVCVGLHVGGVTHQAQAMPATFNWRQVNEAGFGDPDNKQVPSLEALGNYLYAGVWNNGKTSQTAQTSVASTFLPCIYKSCPPIYSDDFSNPSSGWPIIDTGNTLYEYNTGEYRIMIRPNNFWSAARSGVRATNYKVNVDLRNVTGEMSSYGIVFGLTQNWSGWYTLEIYPDGWFGIYRYDQYNGAVLAEGDSSVIHHGTETNHISIERNEASIKAYANGQLLASVSDSNFIGSLYLGLINSAYDYGYVDVRYDNFWVYPLACTASESVDDLSSDWIASWSESPQDFNGNDISLNKHQP